MMSIFFTILRQEILLSSRNLGKILAGFLFFLISISIFFLILQKAGDQASERLNSIAIIFFSLIFSLIFSTTEFLKKDFDDGTIEQILVSCENFEIFILAKMLGNYLVCTLPILISTPLVLTAIGFDQNFIFYFLTLIFLASIVINFICGLCGSLSTLGNSAPMIAVIALPLIIPILIIACGGLLDGSLEFFQSSLKILFGLMIFIGSISVLAVAKIIKIAAE